LYRPETSFFAKEFEKKQKNFGSGVAFFLYRPGAVIKTSCKLIIEVRQRIKTSQMAGAYENSCHYNKFRVGKVGRYQYRRRNQNGII